MSIKLMTYVWDHSPQKGNALLVMLALADWADDDGICWPSQPRIAKKARCDERSVRNVIAKLVEAGELKVVKQSDARSNKPTVYQVMAPENFSAGPPEKRNSTPRKSAQRSKEEPSEEDPSEKKAASPLHRFFEILLPILPPGYERGRLGEEIKRALKKGADPEQFDDFKRWFERNGKITFESAASIAKYWTLYVEARNGNTQQPTTKQMTHAEMGLMTPR